jgi:hypothetical protein
MKPQGFLGPQRARRALCVALAFGFLLVVCLVSTPQRFVPISRIVASDLRAWHRLWTDYGQPGMYGPPLRRKRNVRMSQVGLRKCMRPLLE